MCADEIHSKNELHYFHLKFRKGVILLLNSRSYQFVHKL